MARKLLVVCLSCGMVAWLLSASACRRDEPAAAAQAAELGPPPVAPKPRNDSPMEQIKGVWTMNLAEVPDPALTPEFRDLKARGLSEHVQVEYTITDTELFLTKTGEGGRMERHWYYEILRQVDNRMELEQTDPTGHRERLAVTVLPDVLVLGTGRGQVQLRRKP